MLALQVPIMITASLGPNNPSTQQTAISGNQQLPSTPPGQFCRRVTLFQHPACAVHGNQQHSAHSQFPSTSQPWDFLQYLAVVVHSDQKKLRVNSFTQYQVSEWVSAKFQRVYFQQVLLAWHHRTFVIQ